MLVTPCDSKYIFVFLAISGFCLGSWPGVGVVRYSSTILSQMMLSFAAFDSGIISPFGFFKGVVS